MNSKIILRLCFYCLFILLSACTDSEDENNLVDRHTTANQDIVAISFPANTEDTLSINSQFDFKLQGLKSNGVDSIEISRDIQWSLSQGALSTIEQNGRFHASASAELITLTAKFGIFSESIDIKVSSAKFDQVVQLNPDSFSIDRCRSQDITPIGRYVDVDNNNAEEIRPVDSITINTIEWIIRDQATNNLSQRAHIETLNNNASLRTLAEGNLIIQAKAFSQFTNTEVTSVDFNQAVTNNLNSIKLCLNTDTDLTNCNVSSANVEKDKSLSLIAVANYQAQDASNFNENISGNSKWGVDNNLNASIAFSSDRQQLNVTGETELTDAVISVACGDIEQAIDSIDISNGVVLDTPVSCASGASCLTASASIRIDALSATSLAVTANDTELTSNEELVLNTRPDEISLVTTATFSNNSKRNITDDSNLVYSVTEGDGDVIEAKSGSAGVYTVLGNGLAKVKLDFDKKTFIAVIRVP